ncbi:hypothetical protein [Chryseobacterium oryctis]|uniref:Uncharacterized protein n=1 Tax=Chryseobacterium oryctis TaxID=2952618 RepID=A0ABT3HSW5_9FLAO|nr:hypothetical protein [Chryseobacterium oryctis]MCW3162844.1 hypothetical protein [Chryseobacterium oryctis]
MDYDGNSINWSADYTNNLLASIGQGPALSFSQYTGGGYSINNNTLWWWTNPTVANQAGTGKILKFTHQVPENNNSGWEQSVLGFITADVMIVEPSDAAWPKWVGYGILGTAAGISLYLKMEREIDGIEKRDLKPQGVLYQLEATRSGFYPNVRGGTTYLNAGDVWKYGETTTNNRYSEADLTRKGLVMNPIFYGNQSTIKIQEKIMIYGYFFAHGTLPPGNKIFR